MKFNYFALALVCMSSVAYAMHPEATMCPEADAIELRILAKRQSFTMPSEQELTDLLQSMPRWAESKVKPLLDKGIAGTLAGKDLSVKQVKDTLHDALTAHNTCRVKNPLHERLHKATLRHATTLLLEKIFAQFPHVLQMIEPKINS